MQGTLRIACLALALAALAGCAGFWSAGPTGLNQPSPEEMRQALLVLMHEQPDIFIPEFKESLEHDAPVIRDGLVHIGSWECDPKLGNFEALFTSPNVSMYEVWGRFRLDARGVWRAEPLQVRTATKHEIGEFWRPHEVDTR
jgi:hypothetical protein